MPMSEIPNGSYLEINVVKKFSLNVYKVARSLLSDNAHLNPNLSNISSYLLVSFLQFKLNVFSVKSPRTDWVLKWPGQVVIAGCQTYWSSEVTTELGRGNLKEHFKVMDLSLTILQSDQFIL